MLLPHVAVALRLRARYNHRQMWRGPSARVPADASQAPQALPYPVRVYGKTWPAALAITTRPLSSAVVGALTAVAAIAGKGVPTLRGIAAGLAMTAIAMFGFAVNDIADYHKDRAAGVQRPVAAGTLSRRSAAWLAVALLVAAGFFSQIVGAYGLVPAITAAALLVYSPLAHRYPLTKEIYVAALCCLPLYYGARVGGGRVSSLSYIALAVFVLGREVLMDADELNGDTRAGIRTIAAIVGSRLTASIGVALMLASAVALAALVRGLVSSLASAVALVSLAGLFAWPDLSRSRRIQLSRIPMLLGAVAISAGGI